MMTWRAALRCASSLPPEIPSTALPPVLPPTRVSAHGPSPSRAITPSTRACQMLLAIATPSKSIFELNSII